MKIIGLTQGYEALVDDEDFERIALHKWCAHRSFANKYCAQRRVSVLEDYPFTHIYMATQILGRKEGYFIDHISGDTLDNRKSNLRYATNGQNRSNSFKGKGRNGLATSKYKGVILTSFKTPWKAQITVDKDVIYLGLFESELFAALAYDEAARKHHGDFARTNLSRQGLHQIVTGYRSTPKRRNQIAEATGLRVEDLWPADES